MGVAENPRTLWTYQTLCGVQSVPRRKGVSEEFRVRRYLAGACLVVASLAACGSNAVGPGDQVAPSSTPSPALATPGFGVSSEFLAWVNGEGVKYPRTFYLAPAPQNAAPTISQQDAETLARNSPEANGAANGAILGECTYPRPPEKAYLCWLVDATSGKPILAPGGPPTDGPIPSAREMTDTHFAVIIDAQPGSATAGTIVTAFGA
jgi:hypothetical protein